MKHILLFITFALIYGPFQAIAGVVYYDNLNAFNQNTSAVLVEDFESFKSKDRNYSSFKIGGINYQGNPYVLVASSGYSNFGITGVTQSSVLTASGPESFILSFDAPVTELGFDSYLNANGYADIEIYGKNGLIDSLRFTHDYTKVGFFGVKSDEVITSFKWTTLGGERINTGIDNILTNDGTVSVDLPSSMLLLGIGFLGYWAAGNRKIWAKR